MKKLFMAYFYTMLILGVLAEIGAIMLGFLGMRTASCCMAVAMGCFAMPPMIFLLIALLTGMEIESEKEEL